MSAHDSPHCLIIGAGPGLGLSLARRFGAMGMRIGLVARRASALESYADGLSEEGLTVEAAPADVTDAAALRRAVDVLVRHLGPPEVMIYNAFRRGGGKASRLSVAEMLESVRGNAGGALNASGLVVPMMRDKGQGTILITGGGAAIDPWPDLAPLGVGKAALRNYALNLAAELAPEGIHVATVTICDHIRPGSRFDPDRIAGIYADLYAEAQDAWRTEVIYR